MHPGSYIQINSSLFHVSEVQEEIDMQGGPEKVTVKGKFIGPRLEGHVPFSWGSKPYLAMITRISEEEDQVFLQPTVR